MNKMNKKIVLLFIAMYMLIFISFIELSFVSSWGSNTFNNSMSEENLSFIENQNITRYLSIPSNINLNYAYLNLTGIETAKENFLEENLVGYWNMNDETLSNNVIGGNTGVMVGNPTLKTGKYGNGFYGNGTANNYLNFGRFVNTFENSIEKNYTISFWLKPNSTSLLTFLYFAYDEDQTITQFWDIFHSKTSLGDIIGLIGGNNFIGNKTTFDEWFLYTLTKNGTNMTFYINGVSINSTNQTVLYNHSESYQFRLLSAYSGVNAMNGMVDELGIWNKSLSPVEVNELYLSNKPSNIYLQIGDNKIFQQNGNFTTQNKTNNFANVINQYLNICSYEGGYCQVPIIFHSDSEGILRYSGLIFNNEIIENSQTYNISTTELSNENFIINISYDNYTYSGISATLYYNGTGYSSTKVGTGDNVLFTKSIDIPSSSVGNTSFYWTINLINQTGTYYYNSSTQYQNVSAILFGLCNATLTVPYINFTFKDEVNLTNLNTTIPYATFDYYISGSTLSKTYYFLNTTSNMNYAFCFTPVDRSVSVDIRLQYESTGYQQRVYEPDTLVLTNTTTEKILYLLNDDSGIYVTFQVISGGQPLNGATVTVTRIINGVVTVVGYGTTGATGTVTMWLNPNFAHTVLVEKSGYISETFTEPLTQNLYNIELDSTSVSEAEVDYTSGITTWIRPTSDYLDNETTYQFNYTINTTDWDIDSFGISLVGNNGTLIGSDTSYASTGGTLEITANTQDYSSFTMYYYYVVNGTNITSQPKKWIIVESSSYSIWNFFQNLNTHIEGNIFGIQGTDNGMFARALISFVLIVLIIGGLVMRYGIINEAFVMGILFGLVLFLNTLNIFPNPVPLPIGKLGDLIVFTVLIILVFMIIREERK